MVNQERYPHTVTSESGSNTVSWNNLDDIKLDNWEFLATCDIRGKVKPDVVVTKDYDFNVPEKSQITQIAVFYVFSKDFSQNPIEIDAPLIELSVGDKVYKEKSPLAPQILSSQRITVFPFEEGELTIDDLENLTIKFCFPANTEDTEGTLYLDYIRVRVDYNIPWYGMSCDQFSPYYPNKNQPLQKAIGEEFKYTVHIRNTNNVSKDKQDVFINIPDGLEVVKYYFKGNEYRSAYDEEYADVVDEFNPETSIWNPSIRGKSLSSMRLILRGVKEGTHEIYAYNKYAGLTPKFYVEVHDENFQSPINQYEETRDVWGIELEEDKNTLLNEEVAIRVQDVSMEFEIAAEKVDNLKEYVIRWIKRDLPNKNHFKALNKVNFSINKGERVGVIGFNGAGKSTLLKVLSGVLKPTTGSVYTNGKIAPLLELGAGFDHNYSGRENIFLNGAILGYSKEFLQSKYDEIVEFSELEEFIDTPLKNYSSGMSAKLGFSVATIVEPDILILDEVLSVGDVRFQAKSGDKLRSMMSSGVTVLLVSHSIGSIRALCNRVIWLKDGEVFMDGEATYVCDAYIEAAEKASAEEIANIELN